MDEEQLRHYLYNLGLLYRQGAAAEDDPSFLVQHGGVLSLAALERRRLREGARSVWGHGPVQPDDLARDARTRWNAHAARIMRRVAEGTDPEEAIRMQLGSHGVHSRLQTPREAYDLSRTILFADGPTNYRAPRWRAGAEHTQRVASEHVARRVEQVGHHRSLAHSVAAQTHLHARRGLVAAGLLHDRQGELGVAGDPYRRYDEFDQADAFGQVGDTAATVATPILQRVAVSRTGYGEISGPVGSTSSNRPDILVEDQPSMGPRGTGLPSINPQARGTTRREPPAISGPPRLPPPIPVEDLPGRRQAAIARAQARDLRREDGDVRRQEIDRRLQQVLPRLRDEYGIDIDHPPTVTRLREIFTRSRGWYEGNDDRALATHMRAATGELRELVRRSRRYDPMVERIRFLPAPNTERTPDIEIIRRDGQQRYVEVRTLTQAFPRQRVQSGRALARSGARNPERPHGDPLVMIYQRSIEDKLYRGQLTEQRPGTVVFYCPFGRITDHWRPTWSDLFRDVVQGRNRGQLVRPPGVHRIEVTTGEGGLIVFDLARGDFEGRVVRER